MDKQQKLKIALPVLVVIMAFVWGSVLFGSGGRTKSDNSVSSAVSPSVNMSADPTDFSELFASGHRGKARTAYEEWGQNPFMLKRGPKAIFVEGIMWDQNNPKAIINGEILGAGDVVENKTIIEIKPNSVIIRDGNGDEKELSY